MRTLRAAALATCLASSAAAVPPNDECAAAIPIGALPFSTTVDTTDATDGLGDPDTSCSFSLETVWFTYTAGGATTLHVDTEGSDFPPEIAAFTGGCGAPVEVGCATDDDFDLNAELVVPVAAGQTIHLMVSGGFGNLVLNVRKAAFDATPPAVRAVVKSGDPSPAGAAFNALSRPIMLSSKELAFLGTTDGIFVDEGAGPVTIALSGDPSPLGGTFGTFGQQTAAPGGIVHFRASIDGGPVSAGIFKRTPSGITPLVAIGDPAPGGGTFTALSAGIAASPNGSLVAFVGTTSAVGRALFVASSGVITGPHFPTATAHPCGGFVSLNSAGAPIMSINDAGDIALFANGSDDGILVYVAAALTWYPVACDGAPSPIGGVYASLGRQPRIAIGPAVLFSARVSLPGPDPDVIFVGGPGGVLSIVQEGDTTTSGDTILALQSNVVPEIDGSGHVVFPARIFGVSGSRDAILRWEALLQTIDVVLAEQMPCPPPLGGIIRTLDTRWVDVSLLDTIAAEATCTGGRGIVTIPSSAGPAFVATQSDPTPAGPGFSFGDPTVEGGTVSFGGTRTGLYKVRCTATACDPVTSLAQPLAPVPGVPGQSVLDIDLEDVAGQGKLVAFVADTFGTSAGEVLLASRSGVLERIAGLGDVIPGTTAEVQGFTFTDGVTNVTTDVGTDKKGIAFLAGIFDPNDGSAFWGAYLVRNGVFTELARSNGPAPNGDTFGAVGAPLVKGTRVFLEADNNSSTTCLVEARNGTTTNRACEQDPLPVPPGGTLGEIPGEVPALGSRGPVFRGRVDGGTVEECLWSATSSGPVPVACSGDLLPGGGSIQAFETGLVARLAASKRRVVAAATAADFLVEGLYAFRKGAVARIANGVTPTPLGGSFGFDQYAPSIYGKSVAFASGVFGGTHQQALFLAILAR